ncbi:Aminodeoxyfutalosine deaminase [compost metagenome]
MHHGIAAAQSSKIMNWLADHRIILNVCPTSNIMLGRTGSYSTHPIKALYAAGIPVTVNTDDMLIFNQSVSEEYMNLYTSGLMTAAELNDIRETGLRE